MLSPENMGYYYTRNELQENLKFLAAQNAKMIDFFEKLCYNTLYVMKKTIKLGGDHLLGFYN